MGLKDAIYFESLTLRIHLCLVNGRVCRAAVDIALINSTSDEDVTVQTPVHSPRIADNPVIKASAIRSVSDDDHRVISERRRTIRIVNYSRT